MKVKGTCYHKVSPASSRLLAIVPISKQARIPLSVPANESFLVGASLSADSLNPQCVCVCAPRARARVCVNTELTFLPLIYAAGAGQKLFSSTYGRKESEGVSRVKEWGSIQSVGKQSAPLSSGLFFGHWTLEQTKAKEFWRSQKEKPSDFFVIIPIFLWQQSSIVYFVPATFLTIWTN